MLDFGVTEVNCRLFCLILQIDATIAMIIVSSSSSNDRSKKVETDIESAANKVTESTIFFHCMLKVFLIII